MFLNLNVKVGDFFMSDSQNQEMNAFPFGNISSQFYYAYSIIMRVKKVLKHGLDICRSTKEETHYFFLKASQTMSDDNPLNG